MRTLAKNAPCPCESGRSYRDCHMARDDRSRREERALGLARDAIHTLEAVTCERLLEFIDDDLDLDPFTDSPVSPDDEGIARAWAAYDSGHVPAFIARYGDTLTVRQRNWLEAQLRVHVGLWAVRGIEPGRGLHLRDTLTGVERFVFERLLSRHGPMGRLIFARVVDYAGHSYLSGVLHPSVAPGDAPAVVYRTRQIIGLGETPGCWFTDPKLRWRFWWAARETMFHPQSQLPAMTEYVISTTSPDSAA